MDQPMAACPGMSRTPFPKGAIRHVHNIVHDPWQDCLWVLTGDYGDECRILRASYDFTSVEVVLQGKQQARAVAAVPTEDGLYFASDTPLEQNFIYRLERGGTLSCLAPVSSSSIYGCQVGSHVFFSTMVEPSEINRDPTVRIYAAQANHPQRLGSSAQLAKRPLADEVLPIRKRVPARRKQRDSIPRCNDSSRRIG